MQDGESASALPPTMPSTRQNHERIDALKYRLYMAGHEPLVDEHCHLKAPSPSPHGTDARSRVNKIRAAGSAALFS